MGWLSNIVGSSASGLIEGIAGAADRFIETDEERKQFEKVMARMRLEPHLVQAEINKIEAGHRSLFVAGWRPFVGWVCGIALAWGWIGAPLAEWLTNIYGIEADMPSLAIDQAISLVMAMLGVGGMRSWEKNKGVSG